MDDNNVILVTFDNDHREFNMFEDGDNGNLDYGFAPPPPEQPVPVCNAKMLVRHILGNENLKNQRPVMLSWSPLLGKT